ncbi:MAG TPA: DoxX family membrane protein [Longimicrobiales bacterium]
MELLHLIGRIVFAGYFLYNAVRHLVTVPGMLAGYAGMKGVPAPKAAVYVSGLLLLLGGLSILLGFEPRWGVLLLLLFLLPVSFTMHAFWKESGEARMNDAINFGKNIAMAGALLVFLAIPEPWPYSVG